MPQESKQKYAVYRKQRRNHIIAIVVMVILFTTMMVSGILAGINLFALVVLGLSGWFGITLIYWVSKPNIPK